LSEEAARVIDYGIYNEKDIPKIIENFTEHFINYSEEKEVGTNLVFVYGNETDAIILSYETEDDEEKLGKSKNKTIKRIVLPKLKKRIKVTVGKKNYFLELEEDEKFLFVLSLTKNNETYVAKSK